MIKTLVLVFHIHVMCRNLDVGFVIKCGVQGTMRPRKCVWM
jgi:hypothetical protein